MPTSGHQQIFISYSRQDAVALAQRLHKDLQEVGFDAWLDTHRMAGGATWTVEIEEAIEQAEVVLALLTPGSYRSEICRAEQLRSLRKHKCVIPVLAAVGADIPLHLEAKNYRDFTREEVYHVSLPLLLDDIQAKRGAILQERYRATPAAYITAPPMVANYVDRPQAIRALRDALFESDGHSLIALTALEGMGGIGKTVLAQSLFKDEVIRQAFPDGLVWITVGQEHTRDVHAALREITKVLGGSLDDAISPEAQYRTTIAEKAALIVIDDIWNKSDLEPFLAESPRSRFLFTTRDASIARFTGAREHRVDLLDAAQARELLALWAGLPITRFPAAADDILRECANLPLALSTVGPLLRGAETAMWADTAERLHNADLSAIEEQLPDGQGSFFRAIDVSVRALRPEMRARYQRLAVLLEDSSASLPVLQTLWNAGESDARLIARQLADRSLAQRDGESAIRLHDLQLDYIRAQFPDRDALELMRSAIRLSAHATDVDPRQFASQVVGRLLPHCTDPAIRQFVDEISAGAPAPWLRPISPALHPPGTPLLRTLEGHFASVEGVAVTPDGKRVVSASIDRTLNVWELETGRVLLTLTTTLPYGVVVTPDGKRAVSACLDDTLKVWDLETGRVLRTLEGHSAAVSDAAVTPDGKRAVSASVDRTLKVWNLETGRELFTLQGHSDDVTCVAVAPDGKRAVSASVDRTLKVWDLEARRAVLTLTGHSESVSGVAVTPDGNRAVSASKDKTLKVWELETGRASRTLEGHSSTVAKVAVTPDGKRAVSASWDQTLKVWDLETGRALRTLEGHSSAVSNVAVTPDGKSAVSASWDRTLKVWDLKTDRVSPALQGHSDSVSGVAVTRDGKRAVSASWDYTLKVWDLETGSVLLTLRGHSGGVNGVAVTPDGRRAVSASADETLKVWDLETGRGLLTLDGDTGGVNAVAVTPDGKRVVFASGRRLIVRELETGCSLRTMEGHAETVYGVTVTPDGKRVVSTSEDKTVKVWDLETGRPLRTLEIPTASGSSVAVTPDGKRLVSARREHSLEVWNLDTGEALLTLEGHSHAVNAVAVTLDGKRAVSASRDSTLKMWDLETGRIIATFHCDASVECCALIDSRRIVAGDGGGRVHILSLEEVAQISRPAR